jgi:hypothetical protein
VNPETRDDPDLHCYFATASFHPLPLFFEFYPRFPKYGLRQAAFIKHIYMAARAGRAPEKEILKLRAASQIPNLNIAPLFNNVLSNCRATFPVRLRSDGEGPDFVNSVWHDVSEGCRMAAAREACDEQIRRLRHGLEIL